MEKSPLKSRIAVAAESPFQKEGAVVSDRTHRLRRHEE